MFWKFSNLLYKSFPKGPWQLVCAFHTGNDSQNEDGKIQTERNQSLPVQFNSSPGSLIYTLSSKSFKWQIKKRLLFHARSIPESLVITGQSNHGMKENKKSSKKERHSKFDE